MASRTAARKAKPKAKAKAKPKAKAPSSAKKKAPAAKSKAASSDWRDALLDRMRALIVQADPEVTEERKWRKPSNGMVGVPVWSHDGIICTGEKYTKAVKLTFAAGASLPDPAHLFTSSLEGNTRRAIDIPEGGSVDAAAFQALVKAAVALNAAKKR